MPHVPPPPPRPRAGQQPPCTSPRSGLAATLRALLCVLALLSAPRVGLAQPPDVRASNVEAQTDGGDAPVAATAARAAAQEEEEEEAEGAPRDGFMALPLLAYAPETSLVFAGAALYYIPTHDAAGNARVSQLGAAAAYTLKNQALVELRPDLWLGEGDLHLRGEYRYSYFPDAFFGLGNETSPDDEEAFTSHIVRLRSYAERRVSDQLYIGLLYELEYHDIVERADGGQLAAGQIPGVAGGVSSGLGVMATYDSRDNTISAHDGSFYQATFSVFGEALGSDYDFTRGQLDLRRFFPLWFRHTLAARAYAEAQTGRPPFQMMPRLGGSRFSRGYYNGRFRERHALIGQLEYRLPLFWHLRLVAFGSVGQVAHDLEALGLSRFHPAGGAGLRYVIDEEAGAVVRLDVAFGVDSFGFYFNVGEAF